VPEGGGEAVALGGPTVGVQGDGLPIVAVAVEAALGGGVHELVKLGRGVKVEVLCTGTVAVAGRECVPVGV
jgi:hypothetical protein